MMTAPTVVFHTPEGTAGPAGTVRGPGRWIAVALTPWWATESQGRACLTKIVNPTPRVSDSADLS